MAGSHVARLQAVRPGDGLYYHVADRGNQLSEWVAVRIGLGRAAIFYCCSSALYQFQ